MRSCAHARSCSENLLRADSCWQPDCAMLPQLLHCFLAQQSATVPRPCKQRQGRACMFIWLLAQQVATVPRLCEQRQGRACMLYSLRRSLKLPTISATSAFMGATYTILNAPVSTEPSARKCRPICTAAAKLQHSKRCMMTGTRIGRRSSALFQETKRKILGHFLREGREWI